MQVSSTVLLARGKSKSIPFPNLSKEKYLVPTRISVHELQNGTECDAHYITVVLKNNNANLFTYESAYFELNNEIDLSDYNYKVNDGSNFSIDLKSDASAPGHAGDSRVFKVVIEYAKSYGNIIYQNEVVEHDKVLEEVFNCGYCTRLVLKFSAPQKKVELLSTVSRERNDDDEDDDDWFDPLELGNAENNTYIIDLTDDGFKIYSKFLNFMTLKAENLCDKSLDDDADDTNRETKLYVIAYGFA